MDTGEPHHIRAFHPSVVFYRGIRDYLARLVPFLLDGQVVGEPARGGGPRPESGCDRGCSRPVVVTLTGIALRNTHRRADWSTRKRGSSGNLRDGHCVPCSGRGWASLEVVGDEAAGLGIR
jgi:hypothetical protein